MKKGQGEPTYRPQGDGSIPEKVVIGAKVGAFLVLAGLLIALVVLSAFILDRLNTANMLMRAVLLGMDCSTTVLSVLDPGSRNLTCVQNSMNAVQ